MKGNNTVFVDNYGCFVYNRSILHVRAKKGSSGVAVLVNKNLIVNYDVQVIDKQFDGILGLYFHNKEIKYSFVVFSCYLPQQELVWADVTNFYAHLMSKLYELDYANDIFILWRLEF